MTHYGTGPNHDECGPGQEKSRRTSAKDHRIDHETPATPNRCRDSGFPSRLESVPRQPPARDPRWQDSREDLAAFKAETLSNEAPGVRWTASGTLHRSPCTPRRGTGCWLEMAERVGFEPTVGCPTHAFQACALSHSAISPGKLQRHSRLPGPASKPVARAPNTGGEGGIRTLDRG